MISGKMSVSTFDREEMGIHADCVEDFAKQIDDGLKPYRIEHHKNAIQSAWLNNLAGALINRSDAWDVTGSPQLCFEGNLIGPATSAKQSSANGIREYTTAMDPPPTVIAIKDSSSNYGLLGATDTADSPTTSSIHFEAYWFGDDVTVNEFYWGTLQTFTRSSSGVIVWRQLMAKVTGLTTAMYYTNITKVDWTMNFTG